MQLPRRDFLALGATSALALSSCSTGTPPAAPYTFVLVHGAMHGGWCWKRVRRMLRLTGAEAFSPTLSGLGHRSHHDCSSVDLSTHIEDVANVIEFEELKNVILVGHSYAGMVITGVADRMPGRISKLVFLDGLVPLSGECALDAMGLDVHAISPDVEAIEPQQNIDFGITDPEDLAWVRRRVRPQSASTLRERLVFASELTAKKPVFIACTADRGTGTPSDAVREFALKRVDSSWRYDEIATGHDAMITAPKELTQLLLDIAAA